MNKKEEDVEKVLTAFNAATGCPPVDRLWNVDAMTKDAVVFLKENYREHLNDHEWELFTDELKWEFGTYWRPKMFEVARKSLNSFLEAMGKEKRVHNLEDLSDQSDLNNVELERWAQSLTRSRLWGETEKWTDQEIEKIIHEQNVLWEEEQVDKYINEQIGNLEEEKTFCSCIIFSIS